MCSGVNCVTPGIDMDRMIISQYFSQKELSNEKPGIHEYLYFAETKIQKCYDFVTLMVRTRLLLHFPSGFLGCGCGLTLNQEIPWLHFGDSQKELQWLPAPQGCPECNLFFQIVKSGLRPESLMYNTLYFHA